MTMMDKLSSGSDIAMFEEIETTETSYEQAGVSSDGAAAFAGPLDHDDFGLNQSKIMNVIDSFKDSEPDAGGKPLHTFPHPALEIWESEETRPAYFSVSGEMTTSLAESFDHYIGPCMQHPFLPKAEIKAKQFARIKYLVEMAYADIPVYRDKYIAAGFHPSDLTCEADIDLIPIITKAELVAAFPGRCINPRYAMDDLFPTRSSGSSGQTLLIRVDPDAVVTDTIQGVRQFALQSGLNMAPPTC